jgi:acyl-homoserine lactone acylase PvdQ
MPARLGRRGRTGRKPRTAALAVTAALLAAVAVAPGAGADDRRGRDQAWYILPPGNYGGLPTTDESTDQLPLYDGLTPLRGDITQADIASHFLPEDFRPVGRTTEEATGRAGVQVLYDEYGVAHVTGTTRADVAFGAGWVTARDRNLLLSLGRGPARVAVADVPGIDAFSLVTSGQQFVPSPQAEALVTAQQDLLVRTFGAKGRQIIADAQATADGVNAYWTAHGIDQPPATVNDVIAVTAFIGSIFGAGGGGEATNADLLARLQQGMGTVQGRAAWNDVMLSLDAEAPTTTKKPFAYGPRTGGPVTGSLTIDPGSVVPLDPRQAPSSADDDLIVDAAAAPPGKQASNFLVVAPGRSATGNSLAVMGPQLGYYYPEIVQQLHLKGPGFESQGVSVPGLSMYTLIGRTRDYAWSLTSANHDVRDVFAEQLCEPDGSAPSRESTHYLYKGTCRSFVQFDAGTLNGDPISYPTSVHGPVIGTATVEGTPFALTRKRSTFGRDVLNLAALKDMTDGKAATPQQFFQVANQFGFTFNWAYANRSKTAFFSSGLLPKRAPGLDRRLPTLGTGGYEWQGYLSQDEHPHDIGGPSGLLLNWNNRSAPGFMHGDDQAYGSIHRVELFDRFPGRTRLTDDVGIMNRAATEDYRSLVWPVIRAVLGGSRPPNSTDARVVRLLDEWVAKDAPRLDKDLDGFNDHPGAAIMDVVFRPIAEAVVAPVFRDLSIEVDKVRSLGGSSAASIVDKDLRRLLGRPVEGPFALRYCGAGDLVACQMTIWAALDAGIQGLLSDQGAVPGDWRGAASRTTFVPGLIPDTIRSTNRPTFQQVLELAR